MKFQYTYFLGKVRKKYQFVVCRVIQVKLVIASRHGNISENTLILNNV